MSREIYPLYYEVADKDRYSPAQKRVRYQVSPSYTSTIPTPGNPGPLILTSYRSEGSFTAENPVNCWTGKYQINR